MSEIARTILQQLGGRLFATMTGARAIVFREKALTFSLPRSFARNGIVLVDVTLRDDDLYRMEFFGASRGDPRKHIRATLDGLYADQLQDAFTRATGLDTRF